MAKIKIKANWSAGWHENFNIPKGYLLFKYDPVYRKNLGKVLMKLEECQQKQYKELYQQNTKVKDEEYLRDLIVSIEYHYKKRTLDQNALMWSLYTIEANEMNGGMQGSKSQMVTADELYENDLNECGERETITTKNTEYYRSEYKVVNVHEEKDEFYTMHVIRGTSKMNTKEMATWIDRIFNRIAENGVQVTNPGDIQLYWNEWRQHLNDNKITIHDKVLSQKEYKELNPICEACGAMIVDIGQLSHIKAIGMGGDRTKEPKYNHTSNWLHMCDECHNKIWHQKGIAAFLKQFKHLTYKVNTALAKEYEEPDQLEIW